MGRNPIVRRAVFRLKKCRGSRYGCRKEDTAHADVAGHTNRIGGMSRDVAKACAPQPRFDLGRLVAPLDHVMIVADPVAAEAEGRDVRMTQSFDSVVSSANEKRGISGQHRRALAPLEGKAGGVLMSNRNSPPARSAGQTHWSRPSTAGRLVR